MREATAPVGTQRPGGRTARTRAAVLGAVIDLLAEADYESLNVEDVARRAGVHKTTIYRRWPTKVALVAEATRERSQRHVPVPDTGSFADDMRALVRAVAANLASDIGSVSARNLIAAAVASDEFAASTHEFWAHRLALTGDIVHRAIARGEIDGDVDPHIVLETLIGPLYVRLLLTGEPIDIALADRIAELVVAGVAHRSGST